MKLMLPFGSTSTLSMSWVTLHLGVVLICSYPARRSGFVHSFRSILTRGQHYGLEALQEGMAPLGIITPLPWAIPIFQALPQPAGIDQWVEFSNKQILARKKVGFLLKPMLGH
jgi:hypothetical protein